jgi:uncharacterized membrane protein (Fun14 family)
MFVLCTRALPQRLPTLARGILASTVCLVPGRGRAWDDLRPISEPATPPPSAPPDSGALVNEAFFLKLGFSFMVGLAVGYALKIAFKIALVVLGVILLGVFGLQFAGLVQVDWSVLELRYDSWADWLSVNGSAFLSFVGDNLSSAASFLAGLALGLKL